MIKSSVTLGLEEAELVMSLLPADRPTVHVQEQSEWSAVNAGTDVSFSGVK